MKVGPYRGLFARVQWCSTVQKYVGHVIHPARTPFACRNEGFILTIFKRTVDEVLDEKQ